MSNTHLNLVDYKLATKLKQYGFHYWTEYYFDKDQNITRGEYADYNSGTDTTSSPGAYIIRQWLRNEYECDVFICRLGNVTVPLLGYSFIVYTSEDTEPITCEDTFETFEDAEIAGINYIFNVILKK